MAFSLEVIEDPKKFDTLANDWNSLASQFKTPLLRHEWFAACAKAFCPPGVLSVRIVRKDGNIVAVAPLVWNSAFGIKRLELLGTSILREQCGFI